MIFRIRTTNILIIAVLTAQVAFIDSFSLHKPTWRYQLLPSSRSTSPNRTHGRNMHMSTILASPPSSSAPNEEPVVLQHIGGKESIPRSTFNLIKACVGSGVLALPAGIAAIGDYPSLILPSSALIFTTGVISAYTFFLVGRLCRHSPPPLSTSSESENKERAAVGDNNSKSLSSSPTSLGDIWSREIGSKSSWIVSLSCFLTTLGIALAYSIILGDMLSNLAVSVGASGLLAARQTSILAATLGAVYPLCTVQSLSFLAPISAAGVCGLLVTCAFMAARCLLPNSPYSLPAGSLLSTLSPHLRPAFKLQGGAPPSFFSPSMLVLLSMAATGYLVQFTAPDFYNELKDNTLERFGQLTSYGFFGTAIISILMMSFGYLTFGGSCAGMILNNYSTQDLGATICRFLTAFSLVGTYPFMFGGLRSAYLQLAYNGEKVPEKTKRRFTQIALAGITCLALVLKDAGFVVSLTGALMGSAIIYIFPPFLFLKNTSRRMKEGQLAKSSFLQIERIFNRILIGLGVLIAVLGGGVSVMNAFLPHMLK